MYMYLYELVWFVCYSCKWNILKTTRMMQRFNGWGLKGGHKIALGVIVLVVCLLTSEKISSREKGS